MATNNKQTIATKLEQLEELLQWFESDKVTIEQAITKYEQALELCSELELQLNAAKNQVQVIKKKFNT